MESRIKFHQGIDLPIEMHKVRIVQKINLLPINERQTAITEAGNNTFMLRNRDVFLDMLTDSGVNAMSDRQLAAMMQADDSYAGSETFYRLEAALQRMFGTKYFLPTHQGRACENIIAELFVTPGSVVPMNYHFTTTKAHITRRGGTINEILIDEGLKITSDCPFKGDLDIKKLESIVESGARIAFVRVEAGTNLIGGQPVSMANMKQITDYCREKGIMTVYDASLLADNLYFIKMRDPEYKDVPLINITRELGAMFDVTYFSARKLGCVRGGGIITNSVKYYDMMKELVPLYEGFLTYGGMSVREMEAMAVGLEETCDMDVISQTPVFVEVFAKELMAKGVPIVTPAGGLGCHIDAGRFVDHIPQGEYPAGALAAAIYLCSGVRCMERGTLSEQRNDDGTERYAEMELARLAVPKRVFTLSHIKYAADRIGWLYENRRLIGGLRFTDEPKVLRFFMGKLETIGDWQDGIVKKFKEDFGESL
jgi:tryptophanase